MEKNKELTASSAKRIVHDVCKVKKGERVLIVTNRFVQDGIANTEAISQALYDECVAVGAQVVTIVQPVKTALDKADLSVVAALKTEPDVFFSISENKLGKDEQAIQNPYTAEDGSTHDHIFDYLLYGKKSMRAVWTPGITLDMFVRTVDIDYNLLQTRCQDLCAKYKDAESVHVTAPSGTDIVVPVAGRKPLSDDGSFCIPGTGGNIPAGEVFISPLVGDGKAFGCNGRIVFDGSITVNDGDILIKEPIHVEVQGGFVTKINGGTEAEKVLETITTSENSAIKMESEGRLPKGQGNVYKRNARNIGELGIGLNPAAKITGNMLEDEKAFKTCHFAIGANYDGDAPALTHLDGVVCNPTITMNYSDGSQVKIMDKGILL